MKIFITLQKFLHFLFQLHYNCIYMPLNVSVLFKKHTQFYKLCYGILIFIIYLLGENPQFYMTMSPHLF